ncbi:hypothetical protein TSA6c_17010 [Azospirillum sp. TSA6c]|uniref:hypothetical protein n=1 Tax=Azospirillum sp. TSA6c TaxID=709813 RepID=UPI000D61AA83|nr:hypothetical protein [Azospirillum sp. TSA6c]PWC48135.1 hypothetical protein TSA6c_17010 [Azospirillum sp. TSA6c]
MPNLKGKAIIVLEQDFLLRLGITVTLEAWGCRIVSGTSFDEIVKDIKARDLRPSAMFIPPLDKQQTGIELASRFEAELGYPLPWIGMTADSDLIQRWRKEKLDGVLLEMPSTPTTIRAALSKALRQQQ